MEDQREYFPENKYENNSRSIRVIASQFYYDVKEIIKKSLMIFGFLLLLYILYRLFSFWFFVGLLLAALPMGYLIIRITRVPYTMVLSMHIAEEEDDEDYFAIYGIPDAMLERFQRKGGDFYYLTTLDGAKIAVCDAIDWDSWQIKTPWFAEISNLEFFRSKQAFLKLKDLYIEELKVNGSIRSLHSALVYKSVSEELNKHYTKFDKVMLEPDADEDISLIQEVKNENISKETSI